jgi:hypothetical protein
MRYRPLESSHTVDDTVVSVVAKSARVPSHQIVHHLSPRRSLEPDPEDVVQEPESREFLVDSRRVTRGIEPPGEP